MPKFDIRELRFEPWRPVALFVVAVVLAACGQSGDGGGGIPGY